MNEEFVQFPNSNDEGKQPDDDFNQSLSGLSDDDITLDFHSIMEKGVADSQPPSQEQAGTDAETKDAGTFGVSDESEPAAVNTEWNLPADEAGQPAETANQAVNGQEESGSAPEPFQADAWLADEKQSGNYHSLLILKGSKIWKYTGDLSLADIREVERIIAESRNTRAIDMARYARLGENQNKYLLYTTSISGSLILCSVNYAYRQLSEIRGQTRASASQLALTDDEVIIPDEIEPKKMDESAPAHKPVKLETGEAAQVMLDDLLRSQARQGEKDESFKESDGWIFESNESGSDAVQSSTDVERETIGSPETFVGDIRPPVSDSTQSVIIPKGGYGRFNNGKPVFGRLFHLTEDQIAGRTGLNILKPGFKGITKIDPGQTGPQIADWIKEKFTNWSPVYTDLLVNRTRVKNRKPVQRLKYWRPAPPIQPNAAGEPFAKDVPAAGYQPVITEEVSKLPAAEAWPAFEAEEIEPVLSDENLPAAITVEPAQAEKEFPPTTAQTAEADQLMPPETLEGIDLEAGFAAITEPAVTSGEDTDGIAASKADDSTADSNTDLTEELLAEMEPAESLDVPDSILAEEPSELLAGDMEEDQVFLDESSDFLKEFSNGGSLDSLDQDQDATAFFEEYFNRSGELIETDEPDLTGQTGPMIEEFIPMEEATPALADDAAGAEDEHLTPSDLEPAAEEEPLPDFTFNLEDRLHQSSTPETAEIEMQALSDAAEEIFTRSGDADEITQTEPRAEMVAEDMPAVNLVDSDNQASRYEEQSATSEPKTIRETVAEEAGFDQPVSETTGIDIEAASVNPEPAETPLDLFTSETTEPAIPKSSLEGEELLGGLNLDAEEDAGFEPQSFQTTPPPQETIKTFDIDQDYNQMIIAMQQRMSAFDRAVRFRTEEESEKSSSHEVEKTDPQVDDFAAFAKSAAEPETDMFAAFASPHSEPEMNGLFDTPLAEEQTDLDIQAVISSALSEPGQGASDSEQTPSSDASAEPDKESIDFGSLFNEDVFPWEVEGDARDILEATPTPQALAAGQAGEGLVDLLSDTNLDPVHLGFDQPMYTCILVPELSEYSLTNEISARIREWLPRLSRVFGWQFENISIQPNYLQWTVRVPTGTSQGSIVRKVRQQLSLRIFETFPELKRFSPDGNFWAKGYLVVAGSNPPPAEFLEDFIQKNRKPADFSG